MITDDNEKVLRTVMLKSVPTLFLGAGFSIGSKAKKGLLDGKGLKQYILEALIKSKVDNQDYDEIAGYDLRKTCDEVYNIYGRKNELRELLTECFRNTYADGNQFHLKLASYPWKNIFTVNIDDLVENVYDNVGKNIFVQNKEKLATEPEDQPVLYKLHGCVNNPDAGYIFAESEYTELITKLLDAKLNKFANEMQNKDVIFVGASMDEPDIKYYLNVYENAGCKYRTNKIIFIDPKPSRSLRGIAKKLGAELIEANAEEFLVFVEKLNYNPDKLTKAIIHLNYNGIYRLSDIEKTFDSPYESKIYAGNHCTWQDAAEKWVVETKSYMEAIHTLEALISENRNVSCFSLYGSVFSGKSCMLKNIGYYLASKGYEVLEYRGKFLNRNSLKKYIEVCANTKIALLIDGAAYYYEQIERMFSSPIDKKQILIVTATRKYYHERKKYYLEGNSFRDHKVSTDFTKEDAKIIVDKLTDKSQLSFLSSIKDSERPSVVFKKHNMINLIISLTYGKVATRIDKEYKKLIGELAPVEQQFLLELAVFNSMDIEYYPRELFTERYGKSIKLDSEVKIDQGGIVDFVRMNEMGVALRNSLITDLIIQKCEKNVSEVIISVLRYISKYVRERNADVWYFIFQGLMKEDMLEKNMKLSLEQIEKIFLSVKEQYKEISYYWLQLGLLFQKKKDYGSAYIYLEQSSSIRPDSYKIQHALARNYLRDANDTRDLAKATVQFIEGEKRIKALIDSKDMYKEKAKPFSVTCYVAEKIRFLDRHNIAPTNAELKYMIIALDSVKEQIDRRMKTVFGAFYQYMRKINKVDMLRMEINSPYLEYVAASESLIDMDMVEDLLN